MPAIVLHQPVEGKNRGETVEVPQARADWYVALGYASYPKQEAPVAVPNADADPTLAANREAPDEDIPASRDVEPAELKGPATTHDMRAAQEQADEESEAVRERSAKAREAEEDAVAERSTTEVREVQEAADEQSEEAAAKGDNAADQNDGRTVPVTEPAVPATSDTDPAILEAVDDGQEITKKPRNKRKSS